MDEMREDEAAMAATAATTTEETETSVIPAAHAESLAENIKEYMRKKQYTEIARLFTDSPEGKRNEERLAPVATVLYHDVCMPHLNASIEDDVEMYKCVDGLLKLIAKQGPAEELLLELMELTETAQSDAVFTTALHAMQIVLLRLGNKPRSLEWALTSVHQHLINMPLPPYLTEGYNSKQERLLEEAREIQQLLTRYITVGIFLETLLEDALKESAQRVDIFRDCDMNRRNVLCCFIIQLLGKPLALLDISVDEERKTNTYTAQCSRNLTKAAIECIKDPFCLLALVEERVRFKRHIDVEKGVLEMSSHNMFLIEDKLPLHALAIYFYMILVEGVGQEALPKIYTPFFVFESCFYLVNELLHQDEPPLHYRAVLMAQKVLDNLQYSSIPSVCLELEVHRNFCNRLCQVVGYSSHTELRRLGVQLLRQYILQYDDEGKYLILKNLLRSVNHTGISGYLAVLYKDLVSNALASSNAKLPGSFSGNDFRAIFLQNICKLPHGIQTDLIDNSDKIISTLNALRFFILKDNDNRTGFWDFVEDIETQYLQPLRKSLDLSEGHYKAELKKAEMGEEMGGKEREQLKMLQVAIGKESVKEHGVEMHMDRDHKIGVLNRSLCTFDLIKSLLGRVTECLESGRRMYKEKLRQKAVDGAEETVLKSGINA